MFEKFVHEDPLQAEEHCMLINKLVLSKLFYCSSVWSNAAYNNLLKLQAVQNFAARIICVSRKFDHVLILRFWKNCIGYLLYLRDAVLAFKYNQKLIRGWINSLWVSGITGSAPTYLSSTFLTRGEVSGRTTHTCPILSTRSSQLLHIPLFKKNRKSGQRTFF